MASVVGLVDQNQLKIADPRHDFINPHITAGLSLLIINGILLYMRLRQPDVLTSHRWPYLGVMLLGLVALLATAWLGGELVYRWGVGVQTAQ